MIDHMHGRHRARLYRTRTINPGVDERRSEEPGSDISKIILEELVSELEVSLASIHPVVASSVKKLDEAALACENLPCALVVKKPICA